MNKSRVYVGCYKNGSESLFCQKDMYTYYDLNQKRNVSVNELLDNTLVQYCSVNPTLDYGFDTKRNMIKIYDLDRTRKVVLDRVFIGNVCKLTESNNNCDKIVTKVIKENVLLEANDGSFPNFTDLETGQVYCHEFHCFVGGTYIPRNELKRFVSINTNFDMMLVVNGEHRPANDLIPYVSVEKTCDDEYPEYKFCVEKGKLLEKYRKYYK